MNELQNLIASLELADSSMSPAPWNTLLLEGTPEEMIAKLSAIINKTHEAGRDVPYLYGIGCEKDGEKLTVATTFNGETSNMNAGVMVGLRNSLPVIIEVLKALYAEIERLKGLLSEAYAYELIEEQHNAREERMNREA